jgi:hypothetical protein
MERTLSTTALFRLSLSLNGNLLIAEYPCRSRKQVAETALRKQFDVRSPTR